MRLPGTILAIALLPICSCDTDSNIEKVPTRSEEIPVGNESNVANASPEHYPASGTDTAPNTSSETTTGTDTAADPSFCTEDGATLHAEPGFDFDGDGQDDMLCVDPTGAKSIRYASGGDWSMTSAWCTHEGAMLAVSDDNGDGRSDLVCTDDKWNRWVADATDQGAFDFEAGVRDTWCTHDSTKRFPGDFDGDGKGDEFCADAKGGKWWRYGSGGSKHAASLWCTHTGSWIEVFDANGDGRADLICRDGDGNRWESVARADGSFGFDQ
jgi:hypothetical protein